MGSSFGLMFSLVPVLVIVIAVAGCIRPAISMARILRLSSRGQKAQGEVISSHLQEHRSSSRNGRTQVHRSMSETTQFTTSHGKVVRDNPAASDIGTVDRTGMPVTVIYDQERPEIFVAPRDGDRVTPWQTLAGLGSRLVMIVIAVVLLVVAGGMSEMFGSFGRMG